jgi:hypothetical protein
MGTNHISSTLDENSSCNVDLHAMPCDETLHSQVDNDDQSKCSTLRCDR